MLPTPPVLKTTIIQLNKELDSDENNYEILTNDYLDKSPASTALDASNSKNSPLQSRKKRRRSSANVDQEELAKRKHETKQLHSIIEKKRRIKINREFEALKYLIPACRTTTASTTNSPTIKPFNKQQSSSSSNNGNKIDGMYKLTILKSSVEYILYLHHIIQRQHELLSSSDKYDFDVDFARIPLDVNQYRDIDKDFNFKNLVNDLDPLSKFNINTIEEENHDKIDDDQEIESDDSSNQLPSPEVTPDMAPILTLLNKYSGRSSNNQLQNQFEHTSGAVHPSTLSVIRKHSVPVSPFTNPVKSTSATPVLSANKKKRPAREAASPAVKFTLPDPAINPSHKLPKKAPFEGCKDPLSESILPTPASSITMNESEFDENDEMIDARRLSDQDACGTLLALRRSNIDSLLN